jgi:alpha-1,2-glucosyltransferase
LADNRHYPFYLWRWVFKRHVAVKYWLVPLYLYAATSIVLSLGEASRLGSCMSSVNIDNDLVLIF